MTTPYDLLSKSRSVQVSKLHHELGIASPTHPPFKARGSQ